MASNDLNQITNLLSILKEKESQEGQTKENCKPWDAIQEMKTNYQTIYPRKPG